MSVRRTARRLAVAVADCAVVVVTTADALAEAVPTRTPA